MRIVLMVLALFDQVVNQMKAAHYIEPPVCLRRYVFYDLPEEIPLTHVHGECIVVD